MKIQKMINLEQEHIEFLKDKDASKLIREMLSKLIEKGQIEEPMTEEQINQRLKEIDLIKKHKKEMEELKNGTN